MEGAEFSEPITLEVSGLPSEKLLHTSATSLLPDISVQVLFHVFIANVVFTTGCMLVGAVPYYHYFGYLATRNSFIVFSILWMLSYIGMAVAVIKKHLRVAIGMLLIWWAATASLVGLLSALSYNISPIQFMMLSWGQSISMVCYTRVSPRYISTPISALFMIATSTSIWGVSIYGFVVEHDWPFAIAILVASVFLTIYNIRQIENANNRYDASWDQGVTAVCQYYCDDIVYAIKKLTN